MASEIRVNTINNSSGLGTISLSDTGQVLSGITTIGSVTINGGAVTTSGTVTAGSFSGDGSALTGVAATDNVRTGILDVAGVGTFRSDVNISDSIIHLGDTDTKIRFPAADTVTFETGGSERVRINSSGLVGINTDSPTRDLVVNGGADEGVLKVTNNTSGGAAAQGLDIIHFTNGETDINNRPNAALRFSTNATEVARFDSSGNFGVGTASPSQLLHVASNASTYIQVQNTGNSVNAYYGVDTAAAWVGSSTNHSLVLHTNNTARARIDNSGQLLVNSTTSRTNVNSLEPRVQIEGNNNDTSTLAIISNSTADGTASQVHLCKSSNGTIGNNGAVVNNEVLGRISFDGSDGTNFLPGAQILSTCEANASTNSITANLRFYVASAASSPSERMRLSNEGTAKIFSKVNYDTLELRYQGSSDAGNDIQQCYRDASMSTGTLVCKIRSDGNLYNTNGTYGTLSDSKLKENIVDASSQWGDIKALQIRNYNFKEDTGLETHTQIGVVAQEVELVSPRLVSESPDKDADGNDLGTTTKYVNQSVLYMKSVKALQEAMTRIETLEAANASLEARLTALEG